MEGQYSLFRCTTHLFDGVDGVVEGAWEGTKFELLASRHDGLAGMRSLFTSFFRSSRML